MSDTVPPAETAANVAPVTEVRTFLIVDVRGYTRFTLEQGDTAAARLAARFADVVEHVVTARDGQVVELRGDEALATFSSARQALHASIELQARFAHETSADPALPLKAGIGLDTGEAIPVKGGYRGAALNLAARLCSLAGPGEILATDGIVHVARKVDGLDYVERGATNLKGFAEPVRVFEVVPDDSRREPSTAGAPPEGSETPVTRGQSRLPIGGFLGALPSGLLIGRDEERQRVLAHMDQVTGGMGQLIILSGEPGVGKTRLAQEFTLDARNRGFLVATGSCYELQQALPFYPFVEALATLHGAWSSEQDDEVVHRWPLLERLLPGPTASSPMPSFDHREEQQRLFWSMTSFVQTLSASKPVALLLDDLHWADGSSLELLQHLARHTRGHSVLILGTYRDVDVDRRHPLERSLLDLTRQGLVERVVVRRLQETGTADLVAATMGEAEVSEEFSRLLHHHTDGNPFFVQELLRALVEQGDVYREEGRWTRREIVDIEIPETVRTVIGQRLSRLSEQTQEILREASVLGQTFAFDDVLSLNGRSEDLIDQALQEAAAAGLVRESGDTYTFNHALTQQTLHTELSTRRRRRLHLAAGEALERLPEILRLRRTTELEWHFLHAHEQERALTYAVLVGDQSEAVFAHDDASAHYETALKLAQQHGNQAAEAEVREKLGGLLTATIQYDRALVMLEQSAQLYREVADRESEARVTAQIGRVHVAGGSLDEGVSRLTNALKQLGDASSRATSPLSSVLARLLFTGGRYEEALAAAQSAARLASEAGMQGVLAEAETTRGATLAMTGRWSEGLDVLLQAIGSADAAGDVFTACRSLQYASGIYLARGELEASRRQMERALKLAEQMGNLRQIATTRFGLSVNAFLAGDPDRSQTYAEGAVELMQSLGGFWLPILQSAGLSLAISAGEWDAAPTVLKECINSSEAMSALPSLRVQRLLAEQDMQEGRTKLALERLSSVFENPNLGEQGLGVLSLAAWACTEVGDRSRAERLLARGLEHASRENLRLVLIALTRVRAIFRSRWGSWLSAEQEFKEAVTLAQAIGYPYAEARSLFEWGLAQTRRDERDAARTLLTQALTVFQRLRATSDGLRAQLALQKLGSA